MPEPHGRPPRPAQYNTRNTVFLRVHSRNVTCEFFATFYFDEQGRLCLQRTPASLTGQAETQVISEDIRLEEGEGFTVVLSGRNKSNVFLLFFRANRDEHTWRVTRTVLLRIESALSDSRGSSRSRGPRVDAAAVSNCEHPGLLRGGDDVFAIAIGDFILIANSASSHLLLYRARKNQSDLTYIRTLNLEDDNGEIFPQSAAVGSPYIYVLGSQGYSFLLCSLDFSSSTTTGSVDVEHLPRPWPLMGNLPRVDRPTLFLHDEELFLICGPANPPAGRQGSSLMFVLVERQTPNPRVACGYRDFHEQYRSPGWPVLLSNSLNVSIIASETRPASQGSPTLYHTDLSKLSRGPHSAEEISSILEHISGRRDREGQPLTPLPSNLDERSESDGAVEKHGEGELNVSSCCALVDCLPETRRADSCAQELARTSTQVKLATVAIQRSIMFLTTVVHALELLFKAIKIDDEARSQLMRGIEQLFLFLHQALLHLSPAKGAQEEEGEADLKAPGEVAAFATGPPADPAAASPRADAPDLQLPESGLSRPHEGAAEGEAGNAPGETGLPTDPELSRSAASNLRREKHGSEAQQDDQPEQTKGPRASSTFLRNLKGPDDSRNGDDADDHGPYVGEAS